MINDYDRQRLDLYVNNMIKYNAILDLVPTIAKLYFNEKTNFSLSYVQAATLLGVGLQFKNFDSVNVRENFNI